MLNTGLFAAAVEKGNMKAMFCGHDHLNDYYGRLNNIILGYGRCTGTGSTTYAG